MSEVVTDRKGQLMLFVVMAMAFFLDGLDGTIVTIALPEIGKSFGMTTGDASWVVTDKLEIKVFEISTRIVAGTNPFISGSPYADLIYPGLSTGGRIAMEIKNSVKEGHLKDLMT